MSTIKDKVDKAMNKMHSGADAATEDIREAGREVKHQLSDNEEDVNAKVDQEEEEKGTWWHKLKEEVGEAKEGVKEAFEDVKEKLTGEVHGEGEQL